MAWVSADGGDWASEYVLGVLSQTLGKPVAASDLLQDLSMDSLDMVESVMRIEDDLQVELGEVALGQLHTVADVIEMVRRAKGG